MARGHVACAYHPERSAAARGPPLTKAAIDLFSHRSVETASGFALFLKHLADRFGFGASAYQGIVSSPLSSLSPMSQRSQFSTRKPS